MRWPASHLLGLPLLLVLLLLLLLVPTSAVAQAPDSTEVQRIVLVDGTQYVGRVLTASDASITLRMPDGIVMTIPRARVRLIEPLGRRRFVHDDPHDSRLFFAPTARPVEPGRGYVAVYELFFPFVAYGPGREVTLAGGLSLLPGAPGQLLYAAPKVSVLRRDRFGLAGGVLATTFVGDAEDVPVLGLLYAVGTYGTPEASVTAGFGFGYADGRFGENPVLMAGGERQLSNRVKLLTENYVVVGLDRAVLVSGGLRFFGEHLSADFGLVTALDVLGEGGFPFFPWLSFGYAFD